MNYDKKNNSFSFKDFFSKSINLVFNVVNNLTDSIGYINKERFIKIPNRGTLTEPTLLTSIIEHEISLKILYSRRRAKFNKKSKTFKYTFSGSKDFSTKVKDLASLVAKSEVIVFRFKSVLSNSKKNPRKDYTINHEDFFHFTSASIFFDLHKKEFRKKYGLGYVSQATKVLLKPYLSFILTSQIFNKLHLVETEFFEKNLLHRYYYRSRLANVIKPHGTKFVKNDIDILDKRKKKNFYGLKSIFLGIYKWALSLLILLVSVYSLVIINLLPISVVIFEWFALGMFFYWLLSGFVFFIKKYRFTRYTSSIQRFWRRSYILFWLIESNLILVFMFLSFNSLQETFYMYDEIAVFKGHLYSWKTFIIKLLLPTLLIVFGYLFLISLKWNTFSKLSLFTLLITVVLTYTLWLEFYQIFHIANFYSNFFWTYDSDEKLWSLESDSRRTRLINHYSMILYFLKFWHIVFIYGFWLFFCLRSSELSRYRYPLYSANYQNFVILYIMSWLFMYPWAQFVFKQFLEIPYFWFYVNFRELLCRVLVNDIKLILMSFTNNVNAYWDNYLPKFSFFYSSDGSIEQQIASNRKAWISKVVYN